jgi:hypothetical protein
MISNVHTQSSSENMLNVDMIGKPMSIKDRIRAMNLVAERTSAKQVGGSSSLRAKAVDSSSLPVDGKSNAAFDGTACDVATLRKKETHEIGVETPHGLNSDPGVGSEDNTSADAITTWRRRRGEEKKVENVADQIDYEDDANYKVEQWTISDLTKGSRQSPSSLPSSRVDNGKHAITLKHGVEQVDQAMEVSTTSTKVNSAPASFEKLKNSQKILRSVGPPSPKPAHSLVSIAHQNDCGFLMPKLKPVRRAPHTLALVAAITSPQRIPGNGEICDDTNASASTTKSVNKHLYPPKQGPVGKMKSLSPSHRTIGTAGSVILKESERNAITTIDSPKSGDRRTDVSKSPTRTEIIKDTHLRTVESSFHRPAKGNSVAMSSKTAKPLANMHLKTVERNSVYSPQRNDPGPPKKKFDTPTRSKISERIKAFSSAANSGTAWKQKSPVRYPIAPRANLHSSSMKRGSNKIFQQQGEESSCTSSERQSNDDDSISVSTPMANGTPARLGAHPPTPNSYNSEAAYTSVASSGDGAVAGSIESSQQGKSDQMHYSNVSTPGSSVHEDSSAISPREEKMIVAKPALKITLQSKLEYDKQRAARRSRIIRRQMKVPSVLVAAQKKAQDQDSKPLWGAKRAAIDITPTRQSPKKVVKASDALDGDPTIIMVHVHDIENIAEVKPYTKNIVKEAIIDSINPSSSVDEIDSAQAVGGIIVSKNQSKSQDRAVGNKSMKANVMKQLIKRRRRRKEYHAGKRDHSKEKNSLTEKKDESNAATGNNVAANDITKSPDSYQNKKGSLTHTDNAASTPGKAAVNSDEPTHLIEKKGPASTGSPASILDIDQGPPLPPEIIRSTSSSKEHPTPAPSIEDTVDISFTPEATNDIPEENATASPSDSVSVASSVLFDEYPDDDDEPEPVVDSDDEPEPDVGSFIDMDLSPIKSNDISKHIFDTSTSYRGSPESVNKPSLGTPTQSPTRRPGHIRDLIVSNSTPKRANRHVSLRNVGEMLYSPKGTPLESSARMGTISPVRRAGSDISEEPFDQQRKSFNAFRDKPQMKDSISLFRNHCSDAYSDVSSGFRSASTASATSSSHSTISSRANKLLAERRAKSKKKPEPDICIDRSHATDLARKIMSGTPSTEQESSYIEKSRKLLRQEPIEGIMSTNNRTTRANNMDLSGDDSNDRYAVELVDQGADGRTSCETGVVDSDNRNDPRITIEHSQGSVFDSDTGENIKQDEFQFKDTVGSSAVSDVDTTNGETLDDSALSDLNMDVSNLYGTKLYDSLETEAPLSRDARCIYPVVCNSQRNIDGTSSWLQMDMLSEVSRSFCLGSLPESEGLDVSTVSAVRISQQVDEDVPFDEEISGAIEVEYIPNENISNETANCDDILMHVNSNVSIMSKENAPNYISASSCDTTDDSILSDIPMRRGRVGKLNF